MISHKATYHVNNTIGEVGDAVGLGYDSSSMILKVNQMIDGLCVLVELNSNYESVDMHSGTQLRA